MKTRKGKHKVKGVGKKAKGYDQFGLIKKKLISTAAFIDCIDAVEIELLYSPLPSSCVVGFITVNGGGFDVIKHNSQPRPDHL